MGSIALPALDVRPAQQQTDPLEQYGRLLQLKTLMQNAPLQTQALQQQVQGGQLENQQRQLQLQDQQTLRSISPDFVKKDSSGNVTGFDYDGFFNKAASSGVSPQTLFSIQKGISDATLAKANATKTELENQQTLNNQAFQHLEGLRGTQDPGQRQQLWGAARQWAAQNAGALGLNPQALPIQAPDDNGLNAIEASLGMHAQQLADAGKKATAYKDTQQGNEANAKAGASFLQQYAPTLAQATNQQDYTAKLQAFETLHPDLAGRFPQQFNPKNPQAVLTAAMTGPELADYQQKERLNKYNQAQENYRAQLGRQTTFENSRMLHGLNQIDQYTADPQHGYGQFVSQVGAVQSAIQSAKDGNQLAASLEPMMLALGVSSFAGVHRINDTEINRAGPAAGSAFRKLDNLLNQVGTGKPSTAQLNEASQIVDSLATVRHNAYIQGVSAVAANSGLDPSRVTVFDKGGNTVSLSSARSSTPPPASTGAAGATPQTHTFSVSAWQRANPHGDANAAKAQAQAQGYTVVQ